MSLKDDFEGTGPMEEFAQETNKVFGALNEMIVIMPTGYEGETPTLRLRKGDTQIVLDMKDALVYTIDNVDWNLLGTAFYKSNTIEVIDGRLTITVLADIAP